MTIEKLLPGNTFPAMQVPNINGGTLSLGSAKAPHDWQLVIVYRGKHCPLCSRFLSELNESLSSFNELGVDVVAVSADSQDKAQAQVEPLQLQFEVGYGLTIEQMQALGLFISHPRSAEEADRPFAEPGAFIVNESGQVQITSISNVPFIRPHLPSLLAGLGFIRDPKNNYPIRGTYID
ncbi:peroxiredoxin-like family protein [Granulosicoccus antarcticus]|uniref:Thioredoxin domain-containing protein n=1 Tax=Granulosicoccus antarcticus IMCC3135 TaxID=1192854 RepID=A0A2Z2NHS8_9GAMM|nr:peroxiredoxin-like family protein [Granulosicoccus antarcticus]ASJ70856.1 hypothetical protein IMCC3135_03715 [Granulosicoccus antarcticus IMCC3135]